MPSKWGWIQPQVTKLDHPRSMPFLPSRGLRCEYEYCSSINFNNDAINTFSCCFQWLSTGSDDRSNFLAPTRSLSRCIKICSLIEKCLFLELAHFQRRKNILSRLFLALLLNWPWLFVLVLSKQALAELFFLLNSKLAEPERPLLKIAAHSNLRFAASRDFFNKAPLQLFKCFFLTEIF